MPASVVRLEDFSPSEGKKGKASHRAPALKGDGGVPVNFLGESASCGREHTDKSKLGPQRHAPLPSTRGTWALREGSLQPCWPVKTFSACTRRRLDINSLNCFARQPPGAEIRAPRPIFISERGEKITSPLPQAGRPRHRGRGCRGGGEASPPKSAHSRAT